VEFSPVKLDALCLLTPLFSVSFFLPSLWNLGQEKKTGLQMFPNLFCLTPELVAFQKLKSQNFATFILWLYFHNFP
jgi:hypothetical protein